MDKNAENNIGKINLRKITTEMEESYLSYAMSVIVSRALPDVRDGLKPVQRKNSLLDESNWTKAHGSLSKISHGSWRGTW